jgi:hypothetical protein
MNALVSGSAEWHIAAPLISDDPVVHDAPHDRQYLIVEEECWSETWWLKGQREKVAMRAAVRLVSVGFEISKE